MAEKGSKNTTIIANIEAIARATQRLASDSKEAAAQARLLAKEYEQGIGDASVSKVFEGYGTAIDKVKANIDNYKSSIEKLKAERETLNDIEGENAKKYNTLTNKIATYTNALKRERETLASLTEEQKKYSKEAIAAAEAEKQAAEAKERTAAKLETLKKRQQTLSKAIRTAKIVVSALIVAYKKMTTAAVEQGTELYSLSKRYGATVEEIQIMNRALKIATGQNDLFTNSLSVLAKGMSDIAGNRGQKYTAALRAIGTSYKALSEKSKAEQFTTIVQGLQGIENESIRAAHAQTLLGESGQYIVGALSSGKYSLEEYVKQAEKYSVITTKNAEDLTFLGFQMDAIKSQQNVLTAQLVINAQPTILGVMNLLNKLIPVLNVLTKHSWLLFAVILALITLKLTTAVMGWYVAMKTAGVVAAATATKMFILKTVMGGLIGLAIAGISAFAIWGATTKNLESNLSGMTEAADDINAMSGDYNSRTTQVYNSSRESTLNFNANFYAHGDTVISEEAAETTAQLAVDEVNRYLGALIKGN